MVVVRWSSKGMGRGGQDRVVSGRGGEGKVGQGEKRYGKREQEGHLTEGEKIEG